MSDEQGKVETVGLDDISRLATRLLQKVTRAHNDFVSTVEADQQFTMRCAAHVATRIMYRAMRLTDTGVPDSAQTIARLDDLADRAVVTTGPAELYAAGVNMASPKGVA